MSDSILVGNNDFTFECNVGKYEVWQISCDVEIDAERLAVKKPDGCIYEQRFYINQSVQFIYDLRGYEKITETGKNRSIAKYCPDMEGKYEFYVYSKDNLIKSGEFYCQHSNNHGYIKVSSKDNRYFEYSDGTPYIPIGINMVYPMSYSKSDGTEFGCSSAVDTLGIKSYEKWMKDFSLSGGNYLRIWLGHSYFNPETELYGKLNYSQFAKIDKIVELAKKYGIKLKFTFEQFRHIGEKNDLFTKRIISADGKVCNSADEWLTNSYWQNLWKNKIKEYLIRYGNEPTVAVWELWNEMLCFESTVEKVSRWTSEMVGFIKENSPNQLVTTSFGSLNPNYSKEWYEAHFIKELDFLQVHRYLDQGVKDEIVGLEPYMNTVQAVKGISGTGRPAILAETGAVNDNHSGPFRYYLSDDKGILFADTVFPAFFAGAAGCGQIWHWDDRYISAKSLYHMFSPFAQLVKGINPLEEEFESVDISTDEIYCLILKGKNNSLGYIRNRYNSWYNLLRDMQEAKTINAFLNFKCYSKEEIETVKIWDDTCLEKDDGKLIIRNLKYGVFFKIKNFSGSS